MSEPTAARRPWRYRPGPTLWPLVALVLLFAYNALRTPNFLHLEVREGRLFGTTVDILHRGTPVVLLATGMTFVIATAGVDLSVGAVMAITGAAAALLLTRTALPVPAVVAGALAVSVACGAWNGALVAGLGLQPIVATLVLLVAGRGIAQLLTDGMIITFERPSFEAIAGGAAGGVPITVLIAAGVVLLTLLVTRGTVLGLRIEAVGGNERASRLAGIDAGRTKLLVYGFCGLCAGIAGLIATADIKAADSNNCGLFLELDAILAVVIGGTSLSGGRANLPGSVVGALVMQTVTTMIYAQGRGPEYTLVVKAVAVAAVCLLQSDLLRAALRRRSGELRAA